MKFVAGFVGALVGVLFGLSLAVMLGSEWADGNDFALFFIFVYFAPAGMIVGAIPGIVSAIYALRYWQLPDPADTLLSKKRLLTATLLLGLPASIAGMFWLAWQPPSDNQLLANFRRHQSKFDQLVQMIQADKKLTRVDQDWTAPDNPQKIGVSPARISLYRDMLANIGTPRGFQTMDSADNIEFFRWLSGSAISSDTEKGYAYLSEPPAHELKSLDDCKPDEKNGVEAYRHIQGHWYLFYDYLPG